MGVACIFIYVLLISIRDDVKKACKSHDNIRINYVKNVFTIPSYGIFNVHTVRRDLVCSASIVSTITDRKFNYLHR